MNIFEYFKSKWTPENPITQPTKGVKEMFEPRVQVYLRKNGDIFINAESKLRGLVGVCAEPFLAQTINDDVGILGNAVLQAKKGSLSYLDRENYQDFVPPYLKLAGVSKESQFARHTKFVRILFQSDHISFSASTNKKGTWYGMSAKGALLALDSSPEQIGEQLLKSFEDSIA